MATPTSLRERVVASIQTTLPSLSVIESKDLEVGIYNWALKYATQHKVTKSWKNNAFVTLYMDKVRSVCTNLDGASYVHNSRLMDRLKEGEFKPHELAAMGPDHLFPERWKEVLDVKMRKDENVYQEKPAAMTDQFRCSKCKKRECVYQELQLRSCDEPVTLFITCLNCGHRWRLG